MCFELLIDWLYQLWLMGFVCISKSCSLAMCTTMWNEKLPVYLENCTKINQQKKLIQCMFFIVNGKSKLMHNYWRPVSLRCCVIFFWWMKNGWHCVLLIEFNCSGDFCKWFFWSRVLENRENFWMTDWVFDGDESSFKFFPQNFATNVFLIKWKSKRKF